MINICGSKGIEEKRKETVRFLSDKIKESVDILIILGSGFGKVINKINVKVKIPYYEIPYFVKTNAPSHEGNFVFGKMAGKNVLVMQGRFHVYEGYEVRLTTYPVCITAELGIKKMITTNLSGGINDSFRIGEFMVVEDHMNLSGVNPLIWNTQESPGKFIDMFEAYSPRLISLVEKSASEVNIPLRKGVLAYLTGPNFETKAELRMLKFLGADAVGWSLVPEVLEARKYGIEVLGIICISDISKPEKLVPVNLEEIYQTGTEKADVFFTLLNNFIGKL